MNTADYPEGSPAISPDETIHGLRFGGPARPDAGARLSLYHAAISISATAPSQGWGPARRLGPAINSRCESRPRRAFPPTAALFYFVSEHGFATDQQVLPDPAALHRGLATARNGLGNVYAIDAAALEERP